ncbi:MAG: hypothetical protein JXQ90_19990 [Cyclobacteriaceae bacterium]
MKKSYSFILALAFVFAATTVFAQGFTFRVLANKGTNQVKKAGAATATPLRTGATLAAGDELIAGNGAYIGLMHKTGKTTEVRTAGTQKVADLEKALLAKNTSVTSKYAAYIASKMNDDGNKTRAQRMNATGAVSRAVGDAAINVMLPTENIDVLGDHAVIRWEAPEGAEEGTIYVVSVQNIFDEVIFEDETDQTLIDLDFTQEALAMESLYILSVKVKGDEEVSAGPYGIKKVAPGDMTEVEESFQGLQGEISDDSPLNKLVYASFFQDNGLILDALTKYEEAIEMSPEVEDFQALYDDFLIVNGLKADPNTAEEGAPEKEDGQ